jgi:hypothetical protein
MRVSLVVALLGVATLNNGQLAKVVMGAVKSFDSDTRRATEAGEGSERGGEEGGDSALATDACQKVLLLIALNRRISLPLLKTTTAEKLSRPIGCASKDADYWLTHVGPQQGACRGTGSR